MEQVPVGEGEHPMAETAVAQFKGAFGWQGRIDREIVDVTLSA